jgi:hypothetical protein
MTRVEATNMLLHGFRNHVCTPLIPHKPTGQFDKMWNMMYPATRLRKTAQEYAAERNAFFALANTNGGGI